MNRLFALFGGLETNQVSFIIRGKHSAIDSIVKCENGLEIIKDIIFAVIETGMQSLLSTRIVTDIGKLQVIINVGGASFVKTLIFIQGLLRILIYFGSV